jgi:hypothetical protein
MFLVGGPAFSGTTLLALVLNQEGLLCLDEPDFHKPEQSHRGIPFLRERFPTAALPERPTVPLSHAAAVALAARCEVAIAPTRLGVKTCDEVFLGYAEAFRAWEFPVIAIFRDIRDALVRPLPPWVTEARLNHIYRHVWKQRATFNLWLRYEDLVQHPDAVMAELSRVLGRRLRVLDRWEPAAVPDAMLKLDRHELLRTGGVSASRIGVWRTAATPPSRETERTARLMGYGAA